MGELHGWKALVFLIFINAMLAIMVVIGTIGVPLFEAVLFMSLGYAFGNTILKRHNKSDAAAMSCSHDTRSGAGCLCYCHKEK